ncbi:hypothetical protein ABDJ41_14125 [Pedobacter sp. ASV1-7]|uniref:hypothetical protein n=1 Tax=Pedobacter sp. ASV1-7 TaxID=3145237 RepID=UPI0032E8C6FA
MKAQSKVYLVKPASNQSLDELYGMFDTLEKAETFLNRFKTKMFDVEIVSSDLNPKYYTEKTADPYCILLDKISIIPKEILICSTIDMVEEALKESYHIFFHSAYGEDGGILIFQCLAADEKEAISKTIQKRDELVKSGEWKDTWKTCVSNDKIAL